MAIVLHHSRATGTAKLILLGIANHAGDGGAWPKVSTLATYANASDRAVQRHLRTLERLGEIATYRQAGGLAHMRDVDRPNRYEVLVKCPPDCDRSSNHRTEPHRVIHKSTAPDLWGDRSVTPNGPGVTEVSPPGGDRSVTRTSPMNHPSTKAGGTVTGGRPEPAAAETRDYWLSTARETIREAQAHHG